MTTRPVTVQAGRRFENGTAGGAQEKPGRGAPHHSGAQGEGARALYDLHTGAVGAHLPDKTRLLVTVWHAENQIAVKIAKFLV